MRALRVSKLSMRVTTLCAACKAAQRRPPPAGVTHGAEQRVRVQPHAPTVAINVGVDPTHALVGGAHGHQRYLTGSVAFLGKS